MASPNTTFTSGQILTAAQQNNLPFGLCGLQTITSQFTTSSLHTTMQDNGMTLTITEVSGRRYKITARMNIFPSGGLQGMETQIVRTATSLARDTYPSAMLSIADSCAVQMQFIYTSVGSGSATFKVQIAALINNTAVADFGSATYPRQFSIEDLGPA